MVEMAKGGNFRIYVILIDSTNRIFSTSLLCNGIFLDGAMFVENSWFLCICKKKKNTTKKIPFVGSYGWWNSSGWYSLSCRSIIPVAPGGQQAAD